MTDGKKIRTAHHDKVRDLFTVEYTDQTTQVVTGRAACEAFLRELVAQLPTFRVEYDMFGVSYHRKRGY
jgi:hypothetical protein